MNPAPETIEHVLAAIALVRLQIESTARADTRLAVLGLDSLDRQSIAAELDEAFAIAIPDDDVAEWDLVRDIALTVDRLARAREKARG